MRLTRSLRIPAVMAFSTNSLILCGCVCVCVCAGAGVCTCVCMCIGEGGVAEGSCSPVFSIVGSYLICMVLFVVSLLPSLFKTK